MFVSCLLSAHWPSPPDRGVTLLSTRTNDIVTLLPFCKAGAGWCALTQNSEIYDLETGVHLRCKWMLNWFLWSRWLNLAVQLVPLQHISYPVGQLNCNAAHNRMFFFLDTWLIFFFFCTLLYDWTTEYAKSVFRRMSVSLCDAAMAGNTEEVFHNEHNLFFFTRLTITIPFHCDHNIFHKIRAINS